VLGGIWVGEGYYHYPKGKKGAKYKKNLFWGSVIGLAVLLSTVNFDPFLIFFSRYQTRDFWQPTIALVFFNLFLITTLFSIVAIWEKKLKKISLIRELSLLGQESLVIYVLHILLGYGVSRYILKGKTFPFWASLLAVAVFLRAAFKWIDIKSEVKT